MKGGLLESKSRPRKRRRSTHGPERGSSGRRELGGEDDSQEERMTARLRHSEAEKGAEHMASRWGAGVGRRGPDSRAGGRVVSG